MNSFLKFIKEDIDAKRTLITSLPTKTKRDKTKYNDKLNEIIAKYLEYQSSVKIYIDTKSKSFEIPMIVNNKALLEKKQQNLEYLKFLLNPLNAYYEKLKFDSLIYELSNYYDFKFNSLNKILNSLLDIFDEAGIYLVATDFNYTCYVKEYMDAFLAVRKAGSQDYERVGEIFEQIYWYNPDLIHHIEINFRKLIRKNSRKFNEYVIKLQDISKKENNINTYEECTFKLNEVCAEIREEEKPNIYNIIEHVKNGALDMNNYFEESKIRSTNYSSLMIDPVNLSDENKKEKFYENITKLKINLQEFSYYIKFKDIIDEFKKTYEKKIGTVDTKNLKNIENKIIKSEAELEKLNKKIFSESALFKSKDNLKNDRLKIESVKHAKDLYELYRQYDEEYFNTKVGSVLNKAMTVCELLNLYSSFEYYKKNTIKNVYDIKDYDEIQQKSKEFDLFAVRELNIIMNGTFIFEENNISQAIINKYRLDNINILEENLTEDEIEMLIEKINFILRIKEIEKSPLTIEKIWFIGVVSKINNDEK